MRLQDVACKCVFIDHLKKNVIFVVVVVVATCAATSEAISVQVQKMLGKERQCPLGQVLLLGCIKFPTILIINE